MNTGDQLLRAILEDPEDDQRRLVYADWLEEVGQVERSEFIRRQIEAEPLVSPDLYMLQMLYHTSGRDQAFTDRERQLLVDHGEKLVGEAARALGGITGFQYDYGYGGMTQVRWVWRRGFLSGVALSTRRFMLYAKALFSCHPVTEIYLPDRNPNFGSDRYIWTPAPQDWGLISQQDQSYFRHDPTRIPVQVCGPQAVVFPTRERATTWLSARAVEYGRKQAGLPSIFIPYSYFPVDIGQQQV